MATTVSLLRDPSTAGPGSSVAAFVFCGGDEEEDEEMAEGDEHETERDDEARRRPFAPSTAVALSHAGLVVPGDSIPGAEEAEESGGLLRGHGTRSSGVDVVAAAAAAGGVAESSSAVSALPSSSSSSGKGLFATVAGQVTRVDRLVRVAPATFSASGGGGSARYSADVGDVVVGRVVEVSGKRWRVDLGGKHDAALALSAVSLPVVFDGGGDGDWRTGGGEDDSDDDEGGARRFSSTPSASVAVAVARRRGAEDEASMREVLREGDLLSAEVQAVHAGDGSLLLHARSSKYGRLKSSRPGPSKVKDGDREEIVGGQLVRLPASSVGRQRQQFCEIPRAGVEVILGVNGWVWVSPLESDKKRREDGSAPSSLDGRRAVAVASAALRALAALGVPVTPRSIERAVGVAVSGGFSPLEMVGGGAEEYLLAVARAEREARSGRGV